MLAALVGLSLALAPGPAPPAVELRWEAPAGCPGQDALEREVAALLTGHVPSTTRTPPRLRFRVERAGAVWLLHGEITSEGLSGQRELSAPSCQDLLAAAALLAAIVVDPAGPPEAAPATATATAPPVPIPDVPARPAVTPVNSSVARPVTPGPAVTPVKSPAAMSVTPGPAATPAKYPAATVTPPATTRRRRPAPALRAAKRRPGAFLAAAAGLGLGALPAPTGLLRFTTGVHGRAWSVGLVQDFWLPRDAFVPTSPDVGGRFWMWSAGVRGCGLVRAGRVEFPLCAAVALGLMSGRGIGALTVSRPQTSLWGGVTAGPGLRVPVTRRLALTLAADLLVIFTRPRFEISGRGAACCDDRVGGQFTGGIELRLP